MSAAFAAWACQAQVFISLGFRLRVELDRLGAWSSLTLTMLLLFQTLLSTVRALALMAEASSV